MIPWGFTSIVDHNGAACSLGLVVCAQDPQLIDRLLGNGGYVGLLCNCSEIPRFVATGVSLRGGEFAIVASPDDGALRGSGDRHPGRNPVVPANLPTDYRPEQSDCLVFLVPPPLVDEMFAFLGRGAGVQQLVHHVPFPMSPELFDLCQMVGDQMHSLSPRDTSSLEAVDEMSMEVFTLLLRGIALRERALEQLAPARETTLRDLVAAMQRARATIERDYEREDAIAWAAAAAGMSLHHFSRVFRAAYEMTPGRFVSRVRLAAAAKLLRDGVSATDAAANVGYASLSSFTHAFYDQFGQTPGRFARSARQENEQAATSPR